MAQAILNFVEADLDHEKPLFQLYDRLYQGMVRANEVDAPPFPTSDQFVVLDENGLPTFDDDGNPVLDSDKMAEVQQMSLEYSSILIKNSAYLFASSILDVVTGGSGILGSGFISRDGDSMSGLLTARYGFEAGYNGEKIFEVLIDGKEDKWAIVTGNFKVTEDAYVDGTLVLSDGITMGSSKVLYYDNGTLKIENPTIGMAGDITVDGTFKLGDVLIDSNGIYWGSNEFYHSGNSNNPDVDWTMKDANVYGDLWVQGDVEHGGAFSALYGFSLGALGTPMFYSQTDTLLDENGDPYDIAWISLCSDLKIINGHGIKFGENYVLSVNNNAVSLSAPDMTLKLGDSDNGAPTQKISLQSDLYDYSGIHKIISKEGTGYFPNGLMAQCAVNGSTVLQTYRTDANNIGVLFPKQIRLGSVGGPAIYQDEATGRLNVQMPYVNGQLAESPTEQLNFSTYFAQTTSSFRNLGLQWSATLHFNTDGEFFCFDKPVEGESFSIKSDGYRTRLIENTLFFDDGKFIEGVADGLRYAGNGYFTGNISSPNFASGFAGYGWAVKTDVAAGGFHATFDALTVRKKMRVYELEVQKISCTNGSLWVSDSCSGDEVIDLN